MISKKLELSCWNILNIIIRITGYWFLIGSIFFLIFSVIMMIDPSENTDFPILVIGIALSIIFIILGLLIVRADKYYPEHIKKYREEIKREAIT